MYKSAMNILTRPQRVRSVPATTTMALIEDLLLRQDQASLYLLLLTVQHCRVALVLLLSRAVWSGGYFAHLAFVPRLMRPLNPGTAAAALRDAIFQASNIWGFNY